MENNKNVISPLTNARNQGVMDVETKEHEKEAIRQQSRYSIDNRPSPDNNIFDEGLSNPLSSKGN